MKKLYVMAGLAFMMLASCQGNSQNNAPVEEVEENVVTQSPVQHLTDDNFHLAVADYQGAEKEVYKGSTPCLIDFYADWCGPCQKLSPIVEKLAEKYQGKILFYKVNSDEATAVCEAYGIDAIPCLFFCKDGKMTRSLGYLPEEELDAKLQALLE